MELDKDETEFYRSKNDADRWPWIVAGLAALSHFVLLFSDAIAWDGWNLIDLRGQWAQIDRWFLDSGLPFIAIFHRIVLSFSPPAIALNLVAFGSVIVGAVALYRIAKFLGGTTLESVFVAWIATSFPSFQTYLQATTTPYVFSLSLFFVGLWLYLSGIDGGRWRLLAGAICFFLSYSIGSLVVLYAAVLVLWLPRAPHLPLWIRGFIVGLPVAYWGLKGAFFPTRGLYAGYNQVHLDPIQLERNALLSIQGGLLDQFKTFNPWLLSISVLLLIVFPRVRNWRPEFNPHAWHCLAFGLLLLLLAVFPYAVVGKFATAAGWSSRHALLIPVAAAVICVGIGRLVARHGSASVAFGLLGAVASAGTIRSDRVDLNYLGRWTKDVSIMQNLRMSDAGNYSIYWVHDEFPVSDENDYRFYEWSNMLHATFGGETRIGLDDRNYRRKDLATIAEDLDRYRRYSFRDLDWKGRECDLVIHPGREANSDTKLGFLYCLGRLTGRSDYREITTIAVTSRAPQMPFPRR